MKLWRSFFEMIVEEIELVTQPTQDACVAACMAMLTGKTVEQVLIDLCEPAAPTHYIKWMVNNNIYPVAETRFTCGNIYLVDVPSLNYVGGMHVVLADLRTDNICVYDPQEGNLSKDYVPRKSFYSKLNYSQLWRLIDCSVPIKDGDI